MTKDREGVGLALVGLADLNPAEGRQEGRKQGRKEGRKEVTSLQGWGAPV